MPSRNRRVAVLLIVFVVGATVLWATVREAGEGRVVAPRPGVEADVSELPPLAPSVLSVPIRLDLDPLVRELEEALPRSWGDLDQRIELSENDRSAFAVSLAREPVRASVTGSTARVSTRIHYRARGWYDPPILPEVSASCGTGENEAPPRLSVEIEAPISLTPEWSLAARTGAAHVSAASEESRDRCEVTFLGFDVTDKVVGAARSFLDGQRSAIDEAVGRVDVRSKFEEWWRLISEPVRLDDGIWLVLDPSEVRRGPIEGLGSSVRVSVGLVARPRVVLGSRPVQEPRALPPLDTGSVEPGLEIMIDGAAEYPAASARLTEELGGTELEHSGRRVRVVSVELSGIGGGKLAMEVAIEGDASGRIFLVGRPRYEPETGLVAVPDLEFDVATSNLLLRGASWLADAGIEGYLRRRAQWPGAPAVDWVAQKLHEGLNQGLSDRVRLEGSVDEVKVLGVNARRDALVVRAAARADATLVIEGHGN